MKLALETSKRLASMLLDDGNQIHRFVMSANQRQSSHLLPMIKSHLHQLQVNPSDITDIYLNVGPGSSTGLRMGIAMVQGWVAAFPSVRLYGVYLESMARVVLNTWLPEVDNAYMLADAFAGQIFVQKYLKKEGVFEPIGSLQVCEKSALDDLETAAAIVDDLGVLKQKREWPEGWVWSQGEFPNADLVYKAASYHREPDAIQSMDVRYMKATSAELMWNKREQE